MRRAPTVLGVADHTGWAYVVCVSVHERRPFVVARRRITLIDRGLPTQPYEHDTMAMRPDEAQELVARGESASVILTVLSVLDRMST